MFIIYSGLGHVGGIIFKNFKIMIAPHMKFDLTIVSHVKYLLNILSHRLYNLYLSTSNIIKSKTYKEKYEMTFNIFERHLISYFICHFLHIFIY
jgi:hypothetical protein